MNPNIETSIPIHPLRSALYDELHIRPFHKIASPQLVSHLVSCCDHHSELEASSELISELCRRYEVNPPRADAVTYYQDFGDFTINWERHAEFYSLSILRPIEPANDVFSMTAIELLPNDWLKQLPGQVTTAFHLVIDDQQLDYSAISLSQYFEGHTIMVSDLYNNKAQVFTSFKLHGDGYGRFIVRNSGLNPSQTGQLLRRLSDLETYRLLALLALPKAKNIAPNLLDMDKELADILNAVTKLDSAESERKLLDQLTRIEANLETFRAETNHRFAASKAYHQLVRERLEGIRETRMEGYLSIGGVINRRLSPALRTCDSVQIWMNDLSKRVERASDLMRTRVNLNLQEQSRSQLSAMNRRSKLQFRLQETVEGLSIAAISYYAVGLLSYLFNALPLKSWNIDKNILLGATIPVVLVTTWWITRRIKQRLIKDSED